MQKPAILYTNGTKRTGQKVLIAKYERWLHCLEFLLLISVPYWKCRSEITGKSKSAQTGLESARNNTVIPKKTSGRICLSLRFHKCLKILTVVPQFLFQHSEPKPKAINRTCYADFVGNPSVQTQEVVKIHFREK